MRRDLGEAAVTVLVAADGPYEWSKVHPVLGAWIDEQISDPHRAAVSAEADRFSEE